MIQPVWDPDEAVWTRRLHGTQSRYRYGATGHNVARGCRCETCVTAQQYRTRQSNNRRREPIPDAAPDQSWVPLAKCRGLDPDLFLPERGDTATVVAAKEFCSDCPTRARCLNYSMETGEKYGVWGGWSERQRRQIRMDPTKRLMVRIAAENEALNDRDVAS